mmetsp:Transcript_16959/g.33859  ORF Transcript_16959/g.33859 Transcript_16959/m.33859 type:complete len:83 (+) Transcript_16959:673-921(+)
MGQVRVRSEAGGTCKTNQREILEEPAVRTCVRNVRQRNVRNQEPYQPTSRGGEASVIHLEEPWGGTVGMEEPTEIQKYSTGT